MQTQGKPPSARITENRIADLTAEVERLREDLRLAIMSDSEVCMVLDAENARLRALLESAPGVEVHLTVPDRDYTSMTPLACYEAGMLDAAYRVRAAIRAAIETGLQE